MASPSASASRKYVTYKKLLADAVSGADYKALDSALSALEGAIREGYDPDMLETVEDLACAQRAFGDKMPTIREWEFLAIYWGSDVVYAAVEAGIADSVIWGFRWCIPLFEIPAMLEWVNTGDESCAEVVESRREFKRDHPEYYEELIPAVAAAARAAADATQAAMAMSALCLLAGRRLPRPAPTPKILAARAALDAALASRAPAIVAMFNEARPAPPPPAEECGPEGACAVCLDRRPLALALPCRHFAACFGCARGLAGAPCVICRAPVADYVNTFMP